MNDADGKVVIKAELNTKKLESDLKKQKQMLEKYEKEAQELTSLKSKYEADIAQYEREQRELKKVQEEYDKVKEKIREIKKERERIANLPESEQMAAYASNPEISGANLSKLDAQRSELQSKMVESQTRLNVGIKEQKKLLDEVNAQLEENVKSQSLIQQSIEQTSADLRKGQIVDSIKNVGKGLTSTIKKVAKWGIALFGIRGAYMAIRRSMTVVSQHNDEIAKKMQYISYAISMLLEPLVIRLVNWIYKLMSYIDYIAQKWLGINKSIFKSAQSMQQTNKAATALRKTLAGFDELNILGDNVGGAGGFTGNLELPEVKPNGVLKWIGDNKDVVLSALAAITGALIAMKFAGLDPIMMILGAIMGLGIYTFISGILEMIKEPSWEAFGKILQGLGIIIADIGVILMALGVASGPIGWIIIAIGTLIGLIGSITIELVKNRDGIKSVEEATNDLNDAKLALANETANYTRAIRDEKDAQEKLAKIMRETGIDAEELYQLVYDGTLKYKDLNDTQKEVYDAYVSLLQAQGRVEASSKELEKAKKEEIQKAIEMELANAKQEGSYEKLKKKVMDAYNSGKISAEEASKYISRAMSNMSYDSMKTYSKDIPDSIKKGLDPYQYMSKMDQLRAWWNGEISKFNTEIKVKVVKSNASIPEMQIYATYPGGRSFAKGGLYYPRLPRLAAGGIINQPGRGVPYHGATIGERGEEAILPLTDSSQMQLLGEAIGRYVNINATVPVYVGNRMVARELKKINAEDNFAGNR